VNQLASAAATEALFTSQWPKALVGDTSTALVVATSKGGADDWLNERNPAGESSPCFGLAGVADAVAREIRHGDGPRLTLSGACASGLHALIRATMLIEHGDADRAIVVAAESSMHPLFLQSFRRLGVLPADGERCRPFDLNRTGFLVSEAAAAVILERASGDAAARQSPEIAIDRYAFAGDAGHLTGFSGGTLRRLLRHVIGQQSVDLIHAHGTGTEANDATELAAIESVLAHSATGEDAITPPLVYSHKGAIGHTLGAAGLVSIVLNVQAHREGIVPANANLQSPLPSQSAIICRELSRRHIRRCVSAAAGFGGATAAVSLRSRGDQLPQV
jgi:3-oxoacyl-[acyl-carrier-protein] synthase II